MMYAPIHAAGAVVGILSIQSYTPQAYSRTDLLLLQSLADHCGEAVQRIKVAEALRQAEAKYRSIFENASEGVFQATPQSRPLSANPALARMLGYQSPEELISSVTHIGRELYVQPARREELMRLLKTEGSVTNFEAAMRRKDGSEIQVSINAHLVRDAEGSILYSEGTNQDITERKRAEQELRQMSARIIEAQEAERLRVARELHDGVNQLIASAKMRLHKVRDRATGLSPAAGEIFARCDRLLAQALEENRRIAQNLRPSDLDEFGLATACRNFLAQVRARTNLAVSCYLSPLGRRFNPEVELNLFRIVQEAITNVEKHARAKTVRVRITVLRDWIVLNIKDDGRGFRPRPAKGGRGKSQGIGLTNMRERAASLGGTCSVVSGPKGGTSIFVRVPVAKPK